MGRSSESSEEFGGVRRSSEWGRGKDDGTEVRTDGKERKGKEEGFGGSGKCRKGRREVREVSENAKYGMGWEKEEMNGEWIREEELEDVTRFQTEEIRYMTVGISNILDKRNWRQGLIEVQRKLLI